MTMPSSVGPWSGHTMRYMSLILAGGLLLHAGQSTATEPCKGTKKQYAGKCRYPDEIRKLKESASRLRWISIPGGSFMMGSEAGADDAKPVHEVQVSRFKMTRSEVTVKQYGGCVRAEKCTKPAIGDNCNYYQRERLNHPVNCVDWHQARVFCAWAGGRLPSKAEWEYAARSGGKGWKYPWGNEEATCRRAVMDDGRGEGCGKMRTWSVCSKRAGNYAQGLCDLAGSVWEWVEDCWHGSYAGVPSGGSSWMSSCVRDFRVLRGGSWLNNATAMRAAYRNYNTPTARFNYIGFRCSRTEN